MGAGDIETKAWRNTALVAVVVAVVAVTVAAISLTDDGGGRAGADRAPATASAATSRATTTITPQDAPADSEAKSTTMSGWGSFQPALMYAPVELGQTDGLTLDQHTKLGDQLVEVREAALNIGTVANAERLGYRLNGERWEGRGYEYLLWDQFSTFDINKPTMAVFPDTKPDTKIASVAYQVLGTREAGPPKVFDLSVVPWHHHFDLCKKDGHFYIQVKWTDVDVTWEPFETLHEDAPDAVQKFLATGVPPKSKTVLAQLKKSVAAGHKGGVGGRRPQGVSGQRKLKA